MTPRLHINAPVLIFGGPYSNLQAAEAILAKAADLGIPSDRIICTGDIVAYCADAEPTANLIRSSGIHVIMGNTDEALGGQGEDCGCGFEPGSACDVLSARWMAHARETLSADNRAWLATLPRRIDLTIQGTDLTFAVLHATPWSINRFVFASTPNDDLRDELSDLCTDGVIAGHCGLPFTRSIEGKLWHNAGVIGMPANDGTRDGWFSILELENHGVLLTHNRLAFESETASRRMGEAGLPPAYAESLLSGLWPNMDILPKAERVRRGCEIELQPVHWSGKSAGTLESDSELPEMAVRY
jgi:hypothetical protein